jgi:hypothetical protein
MTNMATPRTNIDILTDICEYSRYGALAQTFVIDALYNFSRMVAEAAPEELGMNGSILAPEAWQGVAREIKRKLDDHLGTT